MSVFVTVGTTSFDRLIETVTSPSTLDFLRELGYQRMTLQIGRGTVEPVLVGTAIEVDFFRYKPSLAEYMLQADLVISHAGSGTCIETLRAGKRLLVVVNEELMHNHQLELAGQLAQDGHCLCTNCDRLLRTLESEADRLKVGAEGARGMRPYPPGEPQRFARYLDKLMGYASE